MDEPNGKTRFFEGRINSQRHNGIRTDTTGVVGEGMVKFSGKLNWINPPLSNS